MLKGQIWIETVIYTLIGLSIIGILLAFINPGIKEKQCKISLNNALTILTGFDSLLESLSIRSAGNIDVIDEMKIVSGTITINGNLDTIAYDVKCDYIYSELDTETSAGNNIRALTKKEANGYHIFLWLNYSQRFNITYEGKDQEKRFEHSDRPYSLSVANEGLFMDIRNLQ